jgi:hypothetical protein
MSSFAIPLSTDPSKYITAVICILSFISLAPVLLLLQVNFNRVAQSHMCNSSPELHQLRSKLHRPSQPLGTSPHYYAFAAIILYSVLPAHAHCHTIFIGINFQDWVRLGRELICRARSTVPRSM